MWRRFLPPPLLKMTFMRKYYSIFILILVAMLLVGCVPTGPIEPEEPPKPTFTPHPSAEGIGDRLAASAEKIAVFSEEVADFHFTDGYSNGNEFNCTWRKSSGAIQDGTLSLTVSKEGNGYAGAEYRSYSRYGYGFYAVSMKPAACSGVISSFFTYTGPSNGDPWDEIDVEFLGRDTTVVQFNYYTNGVGGHEFLFDLGFDASEEFHEYAFCWQSNSITWYVDGIAVYRVVENIPSASQQIMMNVWNPVKADWSDGWSGPLNESALPATAEYQWIAYSIY